MSKNLKYLNPLLGLAFLWMLGTVLLRDVLPVGMFGKLHIPGGFVFLSLAIVHIVMNRNWIKSTYLKKKGE
ncbi:MAG: hypothetical protein ABIH86_00200 [Planctomycetota bacterium]